MNATLVEQIPHGWSIAAITAPPDPKMVWSSLEVQVYKPTCLLPGRAVETTSEELDDEPARVVRVALKVPYEIAFDNEFAQVADVARPIAQGLLTLASKNLPDLESVPYLL